MKIYLISLLFITSAFAELDDKIIIRGKIGSSFNERQVKITDSLGQTYFLPRKVFPEKFEFKQGKDFNLEVPEKDMKGVKPIKKGKYSRL